MPTTTNYALPYPSPSDDVDVPGDMQALAEAVDADLVTVAATVKAPDSDQTVLATQIFS